jgi:hypothetical protein
MEFGVNCGYCCPPGAHVSKQACVFLYKIEAIFVRACDMHSHTGAYRHDWLRILHPRGVRNAIAYIREISWQMPNFIE